MNPLERRLDALERKQPTTRQRIVWIEQDETQDQALSRVAPLEAFETPLFVGWKGRGIDVRPATQSEIGR